MGQIANSRVKRWKYEFVFQLFQTVFYDKQVKADLGATINSINGKNFLKYEFPVPETPQEQQKIASCLSSLDELIAAHNDKLETLKDHKKGLIQNLFPHTSTGSASGQKVPKYRFPEFEKDGEWEEKELKGITDKIGDGIHATPIYDETGEYYFINGNNLIEGKIYVDEKTKKISIDEYRKHKKELNNKTILLSINGTIGNVSFYNNEKVVLGKSACYINASEQLNTTFLYYLLQSEKIKRYFDSELTGSTIKNLSLKSIRETVINIPADEEQQKIASCLSALDELIIAQSEKIEQLQQHKKGLMQGLFPNV